MERVGGIAAQPPAQDVVVDGDGGGSDQFGVEVGIVAGRPPREEEGLTAAWRLEEEILPNVEAM